ncbi:caspase domain-containing protein [Lactifluus volemus]|nr:caspase domain-containing protein [Lactifluus volemus]
MGNFVSFPRSRQTPPPLPRRRIETNVQTPEPSPSSSSPPCTGRCSLASSLVTRAGQLVKVFRCRTRLADVEEGMLPTGDRTKDTGTVTAQGIPRPGSSSRRRALLVGISYNGELLNAHKDVDRYRNVLLGKYGYRPEDITILKDDSKSPNHLQPTRDNILRELRDLVADAAAGDRFTFLYSGHCNQQPSKDLNEEDFQDDYLITIDNEIIIDNELNDILVKPLPTGCSLFALLDACHSGTHLDLPHYYSDSVYVPWRSKGRRRTNSLQNVTVRRNAGFIQDPFLPVPSGHPSSPSLPISSVLAQSRSTGRTIRTVLPFFVNIPLSIDKRVAPPPIEIGARHVRDDNLPSSPRFCASPLSCNGRCPTDPNADTATVVSLAASSDYQRTCDSSWTKIVCSFLKQKANPSYKDDLVVHIKVKEERADDYSEKGANPSSYSEKPLFTDAEEVGEV